MYKLDENFWFKYFKVYDILNQLIPYQETLDYITSNIDIDHLNILDVGCGTGNLTYRIFDLKQVKSITGIDYSKIALDIAQRKNGNKSNIIFRFCNLNNGLPFANDNFDLVVMNNVLYTINIDKREHVLKEIYRVIKPGGKFILSSINVNFRPLSIYISHIKKSIKKVGLIKTLIQVLLFIKPTVLIFYYNYLIKKEEKNGGYSFMKKGEQRDLLRKVGFSEVSDDKSVYSNNAYLNIALK